MEFTLSKELSCLETRRYCANSPSDMGVFRKWGQLIFFFLILSRPRPQNVQRTSVTCNGLTRGAWGKCRLELWMFFLDPGENWNDTSHSAAVPQIHLHGPKQGQKGGRWLSKSTPKKRAAPAALALLIGQPYTCTFRVGYVCLSWLIYSQQRRCSEGRCVCSLQYDPSLSSGTIPGGEKCSS